jgi:hypothetical protein
MTGSKKQLHPCQLSKHWLALWLEAFIGTFLFLVFFAFTVLCAVSKTRRPRNIKSLSADQRNRCFALLSSFAVVAASTQLHANAGTAGRLPHRGVERRDLTGEADIAGSSPTPSYFIEGGVGLCTSQEVQVNLTAIDAPSETEISELLSHLRAQFESEGKILSSFDVTHLFTPGHVHWLVNSNVVSCPATVALESELVLAFSRSMVNYPEAQAEIAAIQDTVATQEDKWTQFFKPTMNLISCNNTDEQDMYNPSLQGTVDEFGEPVRWVSGPNRQFEKMMRWVMNRIPNGLVFMKEFDTVPQMDNHFGNLLGQINHHEPLYMLGR